MRRTPARGRWPVGARRRGPSPVRPILALAIVGLLLAGPLLVAAPAAAGDQESIGVTPPQVTVDDAQPGQAYRRIVTIQNEFDSETRITLEPLGEVGGWTTTDLDSGFLIPPRTHQELALTIHVPDDAFVGDHDGHLQVIAEAKEHPDDSGFAIRWSVAVVLDVTVGGEPVVRLEWLDARAEDVEVGTPPRVFATVANAGNTRTTARVAADILPLEGGEVLLSGEGETALIPGQSEEVQLDFGGETLPIGQYRARVRSTPDGAFERTLPFRVVPPGSLGKDGSIRFLDHEPWVEADEVVRVTAVFANTGNVTIGQAKLRLEVELGDRLVEVLEADPRVAPAGQDTNITVFVTPREAGTHRLVGVVAYDGFETLPNESILNVRPAGLDALSPFPWWVLLLVVAAAVGAAVLLWKRRRDREDGGDGGDVGDGGGDHRPARRRR